MDKADLMFSECKWLLWRAISDWSSLERKKIIKQICKRREFRPFIALNSKSKQKKRGLSLRFSTAF